MPVFGLFIPVNRFSAQKIDTYGRVTTRPYQGWDHRGLSRWWIHPPAEGCQQAGHDLAEGTRTMTVQVAARLARAYQGWSDQAHLG